MTQPDQLATDLSQVANAILALLDARSKDVVTRRFGLKQAQPETLESIGRGYGITRERVRQIESNAKKALAALSDIHQPAHALLADVFADHGGIMSQEHCIDAVCRHTKQDVPANLIVFFLTILPGFAQVNAKDVFGPHWRLEKSVTNHATDIVTAAQEILTTIHHPVPTKQLFEDLRSHLKTEHHLTDNVIEAMLRASMKVEQTVFDEWGLIIWPETHPRGVGDKAYAVLRRHAKPAHFREITTLINGAGFDHKKANPQTVHNELIKDKRFVLVGRGLYGLKEWGYMSGTVTDVLEAILKDAEKPLTSDELIGRVLKQRIVKKNTILLSLQNNKRFQKTTAGYTLA